MTGLSSHSSPRGGEPGHREIGADLNNSLDIGPVDGAHRVPQFAFADMRDQYRARAFEADEPRHLEPAISEKPPDLRVGDRHIRRDDADPPDLAIAAQRLARGARAAISEPMFGASAQQTVPIAKTPAPSV